MIKQRRLEMMLEQLRAPEEPKAALEQYNTPANIASDLIWTALSYGDIQGKKIVDLGCGNGVLGIGASLVGASSASCYDSDPEMVALCAENASLVGAEVSSECADVDSVQGYFDTALQNPPFGAQRKGADRPFLRAAVRLSRVAYSLHLAETTEFVARFCRSLGAETQYIKNYKFRIPFMFEFHRRPEESVEVALIRILAGR